MLYMSTSGVISSADMDKVLTAIVQSFQKAYEKYEEELLAAKASSGSRPLPPRIFVGLAGRPGSGKSTALSFIAKEVEKSLKLLYCEECSSTTTSRKMHLLPFSPQCACIPMDGYHLYRTELQAMPCPKRAFERRGAEWTFSPQKLYRDLMTLREMDPETRGNIQPMYRAVKVPSFDHGAGDPKEEDITIPPTAAVILVEGNYLLFTGKPDWKRVFEQWDVKIFLHCPRDVCTERICRRHLKSWNVSREQAMMRAKGSDTKNGDLVDTTQRNADLIIYSANISSKL